MRYVKYRTNLFKKETPQLPIQTKLAQHIFKDLRANQQYQDAF